jgi:chromosome segregation ATPase
MDGTGLATRLENLEKGQEKMEKALTLLTEQIGRWVTQASVFMNDLESIKQALKEGREHFARLDKEVAEIRSHCDRNQGLREDGRAAIKEFQSIKTTIGGQTEFNRWVDRAIWAVLAILLKEFIVNIIH